jgi:hypothetical protein
VEATSGTSRAVQGSTGTLAVHGAGEARIGMRMHPNRGRSGLHTVRGGGQFAQDVIRMSDMDVERNLSRRLEADNLPTYIPLEVAATLVNSVKKPWRGRREHQIT